MTTTTCVRCGRPLADGYACMAETARAAAQLAQIADMTPAARDVAHGLSRRAGGGGAAGKPGSRLPLDLGAMAKLDAVQNELSGWARHVAEERGGQPMQHAGQDPLVHAATYLAEQLEWFRHRAEVDAFLSDVHAAARIMAGIARGPAAQKYLGPCGAPAQCETTTLADLTEGRRTFVDGQPCEGDVYAREGASVGRCRDCGAEVSTGERQAWLDGQVRSHAFRAAHIAQAYGVNVKTIRSWATDRPARYDHSGTEVRTARPARLLPHGYDLEGRPLFLVGDVLELAAADAVRRAEEQAKRARRAAEANAL